MKIILIKPSCTVYESDPTLPAATLPYGIAYLAGYLRSKGEVVDVIDALSEGINNIKKEKGKIKIGLSNKEIEKSVKAPLQQAQQLMDAKKTQGPVNPLMYG